MYCTALKKIEFILKIKVSLVFADNNFRPFKKIYQQNAKVYDNIQNIYKKIKNYVTSVNLLSNFVWLCELL